MRFDQHLLTGRLAARINRFVAEVELDDGRLVRAHCTNTGTMRSCCTPGWRVALSTSDNPKRKLKYTWEMVHNGVAWIGINTHLANRLAEEAIRTGVITELRGYPTLERERPYGVNSRIDILLTNGESRCYVEVKNVTMLGDDGMICFPDAVTERGRKHLAELSSVVAQGNRAMMLYIVQRPDGHGFRPAYEVDPAYAAALAEAVDRGVEVGAYRAAACLEGISVTASMPVCMRTA